MEKTISIDDIMNEASDDDDMFFNFQRKQAESMQNARQRNRIGISATKQNVSVMVESFQDLINEPTTASDEASKPDSVDSRKHFYDDLSKKMSMAARRNRAGMTVNESFTE